MNCEHAHQLLDAYVDDELDAASLQAMRAHLQACPACAEREGERVALREALRALPRAKAPAWLLRAARPPVVAPWLAALPSRWILRGWGAVAWTAAVAALAFWLGHGGPADAPLEDALVARHVAALALPPTVEAAVSSSDRHRVKPWLAGRVDFAPPVPDLGAQGFTLTGARLERLGPHDAVAVGWRIRNHSIDLFVWRADAAASIPPSSKRWRGFGMVSWADGGLRYAAISDVDLADLQRFAAAISAASAVR